MRIESSSTEYNHIWHKYRPVILRMMIDANTEPQRYSFAHHEFLRTNPKSKSGMAFILYMHGSKALNNIRTSPLAHSLLSTLRQSKTAMALLEHSTYELMLDKKFVLHVTKAGAQELVTQDEQTVNEVEKLLT